MITEDKILQLIKYAAQAPSGHNTQPWLFGYDENSITIRPDFTRGLPIVDNDNHALYISMGCALENLSIAAKQFGFDTRAILVTHQSETKIHVELLAASEVQKSDLFDYIVKRQVTRNFYRNEKLSPEVVQLLFSEIQEPGISIKIFTEKEEIKKLTTYIIEGSNQQFENKAFVNELIRWVRFNEKSAMNSGDGIWFSSMGLPNVSNWLGKWIMKRLVNAKTEAKRWNKLIQNSAGFALFMVENNSVDNWIKVGRVFQRFGLTAARLYVNHSHVNMPCEEVEIRSRMIRDFDLGNRIPLLLIRFGYSTPMPYSFRRKIYEITYKL